MSRRYLGDDGFWYLFCRSCGKHVIETNFFNKKDGSFGKTSRCKLHYNNRDEDDDGSMDYLKLSPIKDEDFKGARNLLERLGYTFDTDESIHSQFLKKHNLNGETKKTN